MYRVITVDHFGRDKVASEWLSVSLAVDTVKTIDRMIGHTLRDIAIVDNYGDVIFNRADLEVALMLRNNF